MDETDARPPDTFTKPGPDPPYEEKMEVDESIGIKSYKMDHKNRGIALIINNEKYLDDEKLRKSSEKDVKCMEAALKELKFKDVIICNDSSVKDIQELFESIQGSDHGDNDCFVAVLLTYSNDRNVINGPGDTNKQVTVTDLIEYLLPNNCESLLGKPKLFFVQACHGKLPDEEFDAEKVLPTVEKKKKIPTWADVLIYSSTVPGFYARENEFEGSWFIQSLGGALRKCGKNKELTEVLTQVNCSVADQYNKPLIKGAGSGSDRYLKKQMPTFTSTLTRSLYF